MIGPGALVVALVAQTGSQSAVGVRDSAGIRITTAEAPAATAPVEIRTTPRLVIGGADDGPGFLWEVAGALLEENARIFVALAGDGQVRVYNEAGRQVAMYGRRGGGPDEFAEYSGLRMYRLGDSEIAVEDRFNRRMHVLDDAGKHIRDLEIKPLPGLNGAAVRGRFADGHWLAVAPLSSARAQAGQEAKYKLSYQRVAADWSEAMELVRLESQPRIGVEVDGLARGFPVPFTVDDIAIPAGSDLLIVRGGEPEIMRMGGDGRVRSIHRWQPERRSVRRVWERYRREELDRAEPDRRAILNRFLNSRLPLPSDLPHIARIHVDPSGMIWAERFRLAWETAPVFDILTPDGAWLTTIELPAGREVLDVGTDYVLVLNRNELDVESIELYDLLRSGR